MTDDELERLATEAEEVARDVFVRQRRTMEDFLYDERQKKYWDTTTGELLEAVSVDGAIPREDWPTRMHERTGELRQVRPSLAINAVETGLTVNGSTWWPGKPVKILDCIVTERGALDKPGAVTYNTYVPPDRSNLATQGKSPDKWIDHVKALFPQPEEYEHFFDFAAHMIQRPDEKINHGIIIAGAQGIGKDTALLPLRRGVGEWNVSEIEPDAISKSWNGYIKSVLLVINEVRPHDNTHKASAFYNQLKPLLASPPEVLAMELKYANPIVIRNLCHVILTTNEPLTMYIPEGDRRLCVMTSPHGKNPFPAEYFDDLYEYLDHGGTEAVVLWLQSRSLATFKPKAPPPMTGGKKAVVESGLLSRWAVADDVFEQYVDHFGERPKVIFAKDLQDFVQQGPLFDDADEAVKAIQRKDFHYKMDARGYESVRNPDAHEWCLKSTGARFRSRIAFVDKEVPYEERLREILNALKQRPLEFRF